MTKSLVGFPGVVQILLIAGFAFSFLTYLLGLSPLLQVIPLVIVLVAALVAAGPRWLHDVGFSRQLVEGWDGLVVLCLVPLATLLACFGDGLPTADEIWYWVLLMTTLASGRVLSTVVGWRALLKAFAVAGVICIGVASALAVRALSRGDMGRLMVEGFQPNLLAFVILGFALAGLGFATRTGGRYVSSVLLWIAVLLVFLTSSRGGMIALASAIGLVVLVDLFRPRGGGRQGRTAIVLFNLWLAAGLFGVVSAAFGLEGFPDLYHWFVDRMDLWSVQRGIDSGLTGRTVAWSNIVNKLLPMTWIHGYGVRSSSGIGYPIDNGYLVLVYETGVFAAVMVVLKYLAVFVRCLRTALTSPDPGDFWPNLSLAAALLAFLVANLVARYLFGMGNPFSLLALLLFSARLDLFGRSGGPEPDRTDGSIPGTEASPGTAQVEGQLLARTP